MKRCNNCGWFNADAVERCDKCGESSFDSIGGSCQKVEPQEAPATVQQDSSQCPKCRYPIVGEVEYCPNCGALIKKNNQRLDLKATLRDIPNELKQSSEDVCKLIPLDAPDVRPVVLIPGEVVVINGIRYRFQK